MKSPIRLALIGLSASAKVSWAEQGHLSYLRSKRGQEHYTIVALLNSSKKKADEAKKHYDLPVSVKTYGSPHDLAQDPDIDLVVCSTRVDIHYDTILPSIEAGKNVFVEWPVADTYAKARELTQKNQNRPSIVGVQGRVAPLILKVRELLASGRIGKVLSSDVTAYPNLLGQNVLPEGLEYFTESKIGGNPVRIALGHMIDYIHDTLGEFTELESRMQIRKPLFKIVDTNGNQIRTIKSDVPDLVNIVGRFGNEDATLTVNFRGGSPFPGDSGMIWTISGEKGDIRVRSENPYLGSESYYNESKLPTVHLHDFESDQVSKIEWDWEDWQKEIHIRGRCIAVLYERYAAWTEDHGNEAQYESVPVEKRWPQLEDGLIRHSEYQRIEDSWNSKLKV